MEVILEDPPLFYLFSSPFEVFQPNLGVSDGMGEGQRACGAVVRLRRLRLSSFPFCYLLSDRPFPSLSYYILFYSSVSRCPALSVERERERLIDSAAAATDATSSSLLSVYK